MTYVSRFCSVERQDAEPEFVPLDCTHAACLEDIRLHREGFGHWSSWECPSGRCYLAQLEADCEGDAGHDGPHEWPPMWEPTLSEHICLPRYRQGQAVPA